MRRVLLVCSVPRETGNATAAELEWLLDRLRPDVLFLEHSTTDFSAFLDGSCGTLESAGVMRYRKLNAVELVPVDLHVPAEIKQEMKQRVDELFDRIEEANPKFLQLVMANRQHTAKGGLAYLNSPIGALLQSEMQRCYSNANSWRPTSALGPRAASDSSDCSVPDPVRSKRNKHEWHCEYQR